MTVEIGNTTNIRELNQEFILAALRKHESVSIAELSRHTNLSVATCVKIIGDFLTAGVVEELEEKEFGGGRPARRYRFNPSHSLIAALILRNSTEGKKILHFIADATGTVIGRGVVDVGRLEPDAIDAILARLKEERPALKAVSLSIPGMVSNGVVGAGDAPCLTGVELDKSIRERHGLVTCIENDMNFAAAGYHRCHAGADAPGLAYFFFPRDYSPGGGLVVNGELVRGKSGFSGELSYLSFAADREEQKRILATPVNRSAYKEYVAKTIIAAAVLVNPDIVVLCGDDLRDDMKPGILEICRKSIPDEHLPSLVVKRDASADCLAGMIVLALSSLTRFPHLLEFHSQS